MRLRLPERDVQLTGTSMTFNEWWETYWMPSGQPPVFDLAMKEIAENAWVAATATERERCVRIAEGVEMLGDSLHDTLRCEIAAEIRKGP